MPIEPCKTLEIGCGTGDYAIWLAESGFSVLAVDASQIAIEKARDKAGKVGAKCEFAVVDVFREQIQGGPFHLFLIAASSTQSRRLKCGRALQERSAGFWTTVDSGLVYWAMLTRYVVVVPALRSVVRGTS